MVASARESCVFMLRFTFRSLGELVESYSTTVFSHKEAQKAQKSAETISCSLCFFVADIAQRFRLTYFYTIITRPYWIRV